MATVLHMDVAECQTIKTAIDTTKSELLDRGNQITSRVQSMVGSTWIAPSATQFNDEIGNWLKALNQNLDMLQSLSDRLNKEISEWENTANTF